MLLLQLLVDFAITAQILKNYEELDVGHYQTLRNSSTALKSLLGFSSSTWQLRNLRVSS